MRLLLAGGGSGGPVAPLLAVAKSIRKHRPSAQFLLVGTRKGPEKFMADNAGIPFIAIPAGKWRRYFSVRNLMAPFLTLAGVAASFRILRHFKPDCIFGAGSFVQVPLIWAGWLLKIPCVIHQQDIEVSLANRLCEPLAAKITVSFEKSVSDFSESLGLFYRSRNKAKIILTGNPCRFSPANLDRSKALRVFGLSKDMPVLLVLGGGSGAEFINRLIRKALPNLLQIVQIIHSTGGRNGEAQAPLDNYYPIEFIADMQSAYAAADIVLSRAGLSTLTELSNFGKVAIIIPMPDTHQEYNAAVLDSLDAALVFEQKTVTPPGLVRVIRALLFNLSMQKTLSANIFKIMPKNSAEKVAKVILDVVSEKN